MRAYWFPLRANRPDRTQFPCPVQDTSNEIVFRDMTGYDNHQTRSERIGIQEEE